MKHRNSFTGACHYGDYSVCYSDGEHFYRVNNPGFQLEFLLRRGLILEGIKNNIEKINVKKWLEHNSECSMDMNEL